MNATASRVHTKPIGILLHLYTHAKELSYSLIPPVFKIREQRNKLAKISYMISHDIRQPLTSILGIIETIRVDNYEVEIDRIMMLEEAAHMLDKMIHNIDAITKVDRIEAAIVN